jgi:hypothetical protein
MEIILVGLRILRESHSIDNAANYPPVSSQLIASYSGRVGDAGQLTSRSSLDVRSRKKLCLTLMERYYSVVCNMVFPYPQINSIYGIKIISALQGMYNDTEGLDMFRELRNNGYGDEYYYKPSVRALGVGVGGGDPSVYSFTDEEIAVYHNNGGIIRVYENGASGNTQLMFMGRQAAFDYQVNATYFEIICKRNFKDVVKVDIYTKENFLYQTRHLPTLDHIQFDDMDAVLDQYLALNGFGTVTAQAYAQMNDNGRRATLRAYRNTLRIRLPPFTTNLVQVQNGQANNLVRDRIDLIASELDMSQFFIMRVIPQRYERVPGGRIPRMEAEDGVLLPVRRISSFPTVVGVNETIAYRLMRNTNAVIQVNMQPIIAHARMTTDLTAAVNQKTNFKYGASLIDDLSNMPVRLMQKYRDINFLTVDGISKIETIGGPMGECMIELVTHFLRAVREDNLQDDIRERN